MRGIMCPIPDIANYTKVIFFPTKRIKHDVTKQFDKSGFYQLLQIHRHLLMHVH